MAVFSNYLLSINKYLVYLLIICGLVDALMESELCPSLCNCKWKDGKRTVECVERGFIKIPESADPLTQVLDLSSNNLQILAEETFIRVGLVNLQKLFLRKCRIGQIDDKSFMGITNLVELDLSYNLLTSIPSATFRDTPFLRELLLSNNPIQKIDSNAFKHLHSLVKLDMSNCEIKMVAPRAFEGIETLARLKLSGNQLSELRPHTVEILTKMHEVELHNNPWYCDCRLRLIKEWITQYNIPVPISPVCSGGPERLIDKSLSDIHIDELACKPDILPANRYIEATAGENATIICRANAIPPSQMKWYWNGKLLTNNSHFLLNQKINVFETGRHEKKSTLVIHNVQSMDLTEFYCVAENRAGSSETNFTLRVTSQPLGLTSLSNGQIAGLSATLVILILLVLIAISVILVKTRRSPYIDTKRPNQMEVVTVVNGSALTNGKVAISPSNGNPSFPTSVSSRNIIERKQPSDLNFCNPVQKPPRVNDQPYSVNSNNILSNSYISPSSNSGNNPDLINDMKQQGSNELLSGTMAAILNAAFVGGGGGGGVGVGVEDVGSDMELPGGNGDYSRNTDSFYPSSLWENDSYNNHRRVINNNPAFIYDDKSPILENASGGSVGHLAGSTEDMLLSNGGFRNNINSQDFPQDYGLPIPMNDQQQPVSSPTSTTPQQQQQQVSLPATTKTVRVWQKGGVPVLPPVTALKRILSSNRNSPDEGYQEGCGTDV